ncbi:MAG: metal transporter [Deltaproteobacteria bacterium]|nr:metal transporter [Deltaproteobacteria bacterium]
MAQIAFDYWSGLVRYHTDFLNSFFKSVGYFSVAESKKAFSLQPWSALPAYAELLSINVELAQQTMSSSTDTVVDYHMSEINNAFASLMATFNGSGQGDIYEYIRSVAGVLNAVSVEFPKEIKNIAAEFGYDFNNGQYEKIAESDRFYLYQVLPNEPGIDIRNNGKPILIVHPYVLGADILAFLPGEKKSYVHCFANQGIPTYVRILKDINMNPAVQIITLEDDIRDTKRFCEIIVKKHNRTMTLNGYCQGGLITLCNILSGKLDGLVDTHITCVAPIDGSRSKGFGHFLRNLPDRFNDLAYGTKRLPNGNTVADGDLMAFVYRLKSIKDEYPLIAFYRSLAMSGHLQKKGARLSKTAAAINFWLSSQRHDLPMEITRLSFASYNTPISGDGTLPFPAFNRKLNMKYFDKKKIKWLICYGESDSLVEKECALAPLDYIKAEATPFPKGHVAIATSWSLPTSACALHTRFGKGYRGPVRFQLDMEQEKYQL